VRFKKIYIETTNLCNLNCDFCIKNRRKKEIMTIQNFKIILSKIKNYTNYIYLHILGEPLLNPKLNEFILLASNEGFNINITTNGYLIDKIKDNKNIRQVNISLHSFDVKYNVELKKYLNNIFDSVEELIKNDTYVSLRLWVKNKYSEDIINEVNNYYKVNITKNTKIKENLFFNFEKQFIWPDLNNSYYNESGKCYGLTDHIGILVDGTIVPCCLDTLGIINLGNIFKEELDEILNKKTVIKMIEGFKNNKKEMELCKHCNFLERG
jgi:radical SAM protein with 4Fe4S-binding SPASM domain